MTQRMTPLRWLFALVAVAFVTGLYVMWLVSSRRDEWQVPPQINSVVLTVCSVVLAITGVAAVLLPVIRAVVPAIRTLLAAHDARVCEALDRRDGLLYAQIATMSRRMSLLAARIEPMPDATVEIPRPSGIYRATACVDSPPASGVDSGVVVVAERLRRRLAAVED